MSNVKRKGYCFSVDAVINLSDYVASEPPGAGDLIVLSSDAQGLRVSILLKYRHAERGASRHDGGGAGLLRSGADS